MPASGLTITEAASRKVVRRTTVVPCCCRAAALGLPAIDACPDVPRLAVVAWVAPVPVVLCWSERSTTVSLEPSGRILSVSRRMSLMFFSSDSQKWF